MLAMQNEAEGLRLAVAFLARRALSEKELRVRLADKGVETAVVENILLSLRKKGYVNDFELGRILLNKYQNGKYGILVIRDKMKKRGLCQDIINAVLQENEAMDDFAIAVKLVSRKFPIVTAENRGKAVRYLVNRGFTQGTVIKVMEHLNRAWDY